MGGETFMAHYGQEIPVRSETGRETNHVNRKSGSKKSPTLGERFPPGYREVLRGRAIF